MRKLIIIASGLVIFFIIVMLLAINIMFFREITPSAQPPKEEPAVEEPQLSIAIPSDMIPTTQEIVDLTANAAKKRKVLEERELEAERIRAINRAAAFAQMKELESNPPTSPLPRKEVQPPSAEELSELEKKGVVSY